MQNFQKTQQNEFDQLVGIPITALQQSVSAATALFGQQVRLDLVLQAHYII